MSYLGLAFKINLECKFIMTVTFYVLSSNWGIMLEVSFSEPFFFSSCDIEWLSLAKLQPCPIPLRTQRSWQLCQLYTELLWYKHCFFPGSQLLHNLLKISTVPGAANMLCRQKPPYNFVESFYNPLNLFHFLW